MCSIFQCWDQRFVWWGGLQIFAAFGEPPKKNLVSLIYRILQFFYFRNSLTHRQILANSSYEWWQMWWWLHQKIVTLLHMVVLWQLQPNLSRSRAETNQVLVATTNASSLEVQFLAAIRTLFTALDSSCLFRVVIGIDPQPDGKIKLYGIWFCAMHNVAIWLKRCWKWVAK